MYVLRQWATAYGEVGLMLWIVSCKLERWRVLSSRIISTTYVLLHSRDNQRILRQEASGNEVRREVENHFIPFDRYLVTCAVLREFLKAGVWYRVHSLLLPRVQKGEKAWIWMAARNIALQNSRCWDFRVRQLLPSILYVPKLAEASTCTILCPRPISTPRKCR